MSTISAGTSSGTALVSTGDTTGALVLQTNGTTTAVTIGTNQVVTLVQPLPVASGGTGGSATPTAGGVVYGTGTVQAVTAAGTSGQVLRSNGASAPTWVTPSAGALVLLSTVTASAAATVDLENTIDSTYNTYMVIASGFTISDASNGVRVRYKVAGAYVDSATYVFQRLRITSDFGTYATTQAGYASPANAISIINNIGNSGGACGSFTLYLYNPSSTTVNKQIIWQSAGIAADLETSLSPGAGQNTGTGAVTGLRFAATAGTITGTFRLYGVANS